MTFLRSVDNSRAATRTTHAKAPVVDDDDDDAAYHKEGSSDSSTEVDTEGFIAVKCTRDEGASSSQVDPPNLPEEKERREKRQKDTPGPDSQLGSGHSSPSAKGRRSTDATSKSPSKAYKRPVSHFFSCFVHYSRLAFYI